jgi:hypothetical protein
MGIVTDAPSSPAPRPDPDGGDVLIDPYHVAPPPPPPPRVERPWMALGAVLAALLIGPVGAVLAMLLGYYARREIERAETRRSGYGLATLGLVLGVVLTPAWAAALSYFAWTHGHRVDPITTDEPSDAVPAAPPAVANPTLPSTAAPAAPAGPPPFAPRNTRVSHEGRITLVDVGSHSALLSDELAKERAEAASARQTLLVMTTRAACEPCRGVDESERPRGRRSS